MANVSRANVAAQRHSCCGRRAHQAECQTNSGAPVRPCLAAKRPIEPEIGTTMSQYEFSVSVQTRYLPEQSDPDSRQYAFAYTLTIRNTGQVAAQLISRHWIITDSNDHVQEVKGLGVVGHQPLLPPGEQFEYTSWAVIATPVGTMRGEYFCVAEDGERFEAPIAEFALHMPRTLH
ncbi:ApaG protein [Caballeronia glebae]|jgi:ApaG protein|uniref:Protein ApaG n=2 Tax=Caballeronia glebae TaxID=1777143 RepID=A0A158D977_9BURK|nr:ApaG protein [Caballeronia glebae]